MGNANSSDTGKSKSSSRASPPSKGDRKKDKPKTKHVGFSAAGPTNIDQAMELKKRPSGIISESSFHMPVGQVVRGRSGINTNAPADGDVIFMLLHVANVPPMDIMSESDVYVTAQVFDGEVPISELLFWPVRDNAKFPVWNSSRTSRKLSSLQAGNVIKFNVYDWDEYTDDDLIGSGSYLIAKDFHLRTKEDPITLKMTLTLQAQAAALAATVPKVISSTAKQTKDGLSSCLDLPQKFKFMNKKVDPKKKGASAPPMELTFVITEQRERSRLAHKRVFFIVNAESAADEAEQKAKDDAQKLKNLFKGIPSDNGLSIGGITQAVALSRKVAQQQKRLGEMRKEFKLSGRSLEKMDKIFSPEDKMIVDFLRASTVISSPQSRCIGTAMIALQDHIAMGSSRQKLINMESKTIAERAERIHQDRLMSDPKAPAIEGGGIVLASHLRDIFVNRAWLDFGEKRGRDIQKRALKLLKEVDHININETMENLDWVEAYTRFEEVKVYPNDCFHEWWEDKPEKPRSLQQRSCEILQMFRSMRDEVSICVVGGKILRHVLRDACDNELVDGLKPPNANFTRCCVVCVDFDFTRNLHSSITDIKFMFDGKIEKRYNSTKTRIKERRLLNKEKEDQLSDSPGASEPTYVPPPTNTPSLPPPTPLNADKKKKRPKRMSSSFVELIPDVLEEEEIEMEEFAELLEEEPDIVLAVGGFFLEHVNDPQFQSSVQRLFTGPPVDFARHRAELESNYDMESKISKKQAKLKLVTGLKAMGIVLNHTDVEDVFGRFANKVSVTSSKDRHHTTKPGEDPSEVLMEVVKDIIEQRKKSALLEEQMGGFKRKNTMKEKLHRSSQLFNVGKFPNLGGMNLDNDEEMKSGASMDRVRKSSIGSWHNSSLVNSLVSQPTREADVKAMMLQDQHIADVKRHDENEKRGLVGLSDSPERPSHIDRSDSLESEDGHVEAKKELDSFMRGASMELEEKSIALKNQEMKDDDSDDSELDEVVVQVRNVSSRALMGI